jgi:arginine decarboxylase
MFSLGLLDLVARRRSRASTGSWRSRIVALHRGLRYVPEEVKELETSLGDQYICKFSVFQSCSITGHSASCSRSCRSIGWIRSRTARGRGWISRAIPTARISKFIDLQDVRETLPLHSIKNGESYYLGVFMVGAYQDIMGDLHNLFGRVTEVHVFLDPDEESGWYIEEVIEGSTVGQVLALTQWDKVELMRLVKTQVDAAIKAIA